MLAVVLLAVLLACTGPGGSFPSAPFVPSMSAPSAPAEPGGSPTAEPTAEPATVPAATPEASPAEPAVSDDPTGEGGSIDTADEALAAVVAAFPEFDGYALESPGGDTIIGASTSVIAQDAEDGIRLIFMTGSGDCMAGCINKAFDVFLVAPDGTVTEECSWRQEGGEVVTGTPCVDLLPGL
jgi:hypothetical protein